MKRLFVAVNLPQEIKQKIEAILKELPVYYEDNIRFLEPKNWHLTISFLGSQSDEKINDMVNSIKQTILALSHRIVPGFEIEFERIIFGPADAKALTGKPPKSPRMIWLIGSQKTSQILSQIKNELENNLIKNGVKFKREHREFNCHLTLARLRTSDVRRMDVGRPKIEGLSFITQSLDLMESHLKRNGAEYEILAQLTFPQK